MDTLLRKLIHIAQVIFFLTILLISLPVYSSEVRSSGSQTKDSQDNVSSADQSEIESIPSKEIFNREYLCFDIYSVEDSLSQSTVGRNVTRFQVGGQVYASTGLRFGGSAEFAKLPEDEVVAIKPSMTFEKVAAVPNEGLGGLSIFSKGNIQKRKQMLIISASCSVGSIAVQLAKYFGAEVTDVCSITNLTWIISLGADYVIDYTKGDYLENGKRSDLIFDAVRKMISGISESKARRALSTNGIFISIKMSSKKRAEDLVSLKELIEDEMIKPVIDRQYPLEKVAMAHRYVEKGHKKAMLLSWCRKQ